MGACSESCKFSLSISSGGLPPPSRIPERLHDHGSDQVRIADRGERNKMSAARKVLDQAARHFYGETGFADPARAGDRDQAHISTQQKFLSGGYILLPPHQPGPLHRKIDRPGLHLLRRLLGEAVADGRQFPRKVPGGGVTLLGLFGQASLNRPAQRSGNVGISLGDRFGLFPQNGHHGFGGCVSLKGALAGHHLVEHKAERKLVGSKIQRGRRRPAPATCIPRFPEHAGRVCELERGVLLRSVPLGERRAWPGQSRGF